MTKEKIYNNIIDYLIDRQWVRLDSNSRYDIFQPDVRFNFTSDYKVYIPNNHHKTDFESNIIKMLVVISEIHNDNIDDLYDTIVENKQILNFHLENASIKDGKPPIAQFENFMGKIKNLLYDSASFTVLKKTHNFEKDIEEAERYINYCRFIKNEKGSLITKVELPNEEEIKIGNLFEPGIQGFKVNEKLINVFDYVNNNILKEDYNEPTDQDLLRNQDLINVNLIEKIKEFYQSIDLSDIDLELKRIKNNRKIITKDLTEKKVSSLGLFVKDVRKKINEIKPMILTGKVVSLKSTDVTGDKNTITLKTTIDNVNKDVQVTLSSEEYHNALQAHGENKTVKVSGTLEKQKSYYKVIELQEFSVIDNGNSNN
jgi:hypothetical protein